MFRGADPRQTATELPIAYRSHFRADLQDALTIIPPSSGVSLLSSTEHARIWVDRMLQSGVPIVYSSGGWEGALPHIQTMKWIEDRKVPVLLGLEQPEYIVQQKGRTPITSLEERVHAWLHLAPPGGRVLILSKNIENYDDYAAELGVFKRKGVYHLADTHDAPTIANARRNRCYSQKYFLPIHFGKLHSSDYR